MYRVWAVADMIASVARWLGRWPVDLRIQESYTSSITETEKTQIVPRKPPLLPQQLLRRLLCNGPGH